MKALALALALFAAAAAADPIPFATLSAVGQNTVVNFGTANGRPAVLLKTTVKFCATCAPQVYCGVIDLTTLQAGPLPAGDLILSDLLFTVSVPGATYLDSSVVAWCAK